MAADADDEGRSYDMSRRSLQARRTRRAVVDAAHRSFVEVGYAATTMAAVADEAGVSVETVYKSFGNKPGLAKAVFDAAMAGDDEPTPLLQRDFVERTTGESDPIQKLEQYGEHLVEVMPRVGPIQLVLRAAAEVDQGALDVWEQVQAERLTGVTAFAAHLAADGHLREDVDADEARDVLWTFDSPDVWDLLVTTRGWTTERYGQWVAQQLVAALL